MKILLLLILVPLTVYFCSGIYKAYDNYKNRDKRLQFVYHGGYPNFKGPKAINIQNEGTYLSIHNIKVQKENIKEIKLVPYSAASNALTGAAVGGILLGPAGALAGAAMSSGTPANNNFIQLTCLESGISYDMFFGGPNIMNKYPLLKQMVGSGKQV